jgi:hypothetical protein
MIWSLVAVFLLDEWGLNGTIVELILSDATHLVFILNRFNKLDNVVYGHFAHYGHFDHFKTLNFIISSRRRHRRRRQYEIIQKIFN